jgi:hypothetical protein
MKVFLSWSGSRSRAVAEALSDWLPQVIQSVDPWISSDIDKGARWIQEIASQLESMRIGIICLTQDNLSAPWILFESGALSKTKEAYVCTFLLDIRPASVEQPLGQFNHTAYQKEDVYRLLQTINKTVGSSGERPLSEAQLEAAFEVWWPKLDLKLKAIGPAGTSEGNVERRDRDVLEEILEIVRGIQRPTQPPAGESEEASEPAEAVPLHHYRLRLLEAASWSKEARRKLARGIAVKVDHVVRTTFTTHGPFRINLFTSQPVLANVKLVLETLGHPNADIKKIKTLPDAKIKILTTSSGVSD